MQEYPSYRQNKHFMGITEKSIVFIIVFITLMLFAFLAWYFSHKARHRQMLMLIEKGIDIEKVKPGKKFSFPWLKLGIAVIGFSMGLLIIAVLDHNNLLKGPGALPLSILGISSGISLVIAHYFTKKTIE